MNADGPPPNLRSLDARLNNLAKAVQLPPGRVRRLVSVVVVGQMLQSSGSGVVKGATNLEFRLGTAETRLSGDLDAVRRATLVQFRDELALALRDGWAGFTGALVDDGEIPAPLPPQYAPHRFRAKLEYRERPFSTVIVEVGAEEVGDLESIEPVEPVDAAEWFGRLGLPAPEPIPSLNLAHQVAQKLHACTAPDDGEWVNDRVHDLVDLQLAVGVFHGDLRDIRVAAERLFASRRRHDWPPIVTARDGWDARYPQESGGLEVLQTLDEAIAWTNELITAIARK